MNIELTTTERNALVNILRRHEHSDGARSVLEKIEPGCSLGDRFIQVGGRFDGYEYVLAKAEPAKVFLVNVETGNYWNEPVKVRNTRNIRRDEFTKIAGIGIFKKIGEE